MCRQPTFRSISCLLTTTVVVLTQFSQIRADVLTNVPEASHYTLLFDVSLPNGTHAWNSNAIPYTVDNRGTIGPYSRVGYYLELDNGSGTQWAYASFDAHSFNPLHLGIPSTGSNGTGGTVFQTNVSNLYVASNVGSIVQQPHIQTGNIEFWPSGYNRTNAASVPGASGSLYDFGDGGAGTGAGYGSMQVHNHGAAQTIIAYNRWGGGTGELGIGNQPTGEPDWTFADNAGSYTVKRIQAVAGSGAAVAAPESRNFDLVYSVDLPNGTHAWNSNAIPYSVNNSGSLTGPYDRIGYYMELQDAAGNTQYAWASMNQFTQDAGEIGIPSSGTNGNGGIVFQQNVANMNVASNVSGVVNGTGIGTGNIEFWSLNYLTANGVGVPNASNSLYDTGDTPSAGGYGSMQIHNHGASADQTIIAYNAWGGGSGELGIGNQPTGQPDWTFSDNAGSYTVKKIEVYAQTPNVFSNVSEAADFELVYALNVPGGPGNADFNANGTPYSIDNSSAITQPIDRIGYYLELQGPGDATPQWVYVSMDAFTQDATLIGIPDISTSAFFQQDVDNLNVDSNVAGIVTGSGLDGGNIEFWPSSYGPPNAAGVPGASDSLFDFGDGNADTTAGYGSFQIHNHDALQTLLALNAWGTATQIGDVGIGNQPTGHPDWTFAANVDDFFIRNLYVLAHIAVPELTTSPTDGSTIAIEVDPNTAELISDAFQLVNSGDTNSIIDVTGFSVTGADAGLFDVPDFAATQLVAGASDKVFFDLLFNGNAQAGDFSALLTFSTSAGDVTFDLAATVVAVPESSSVAIWTLLGLGLAGFGFYSTRRKR